MDGGGDALADVRRWLVGCRLQLDRLRSDRGRWIAAVAEMRWQREVPSSLMAVLDQIAVDHHFLVRSTRSLHKAIDRLDHDHPLRVPTKRAARRLAALEETWCTIAAALRGRAPTGAGRASLGDGPWGRWDAEQARLELRRARELDDLEDLLDRLDHALAGDGATQWPAVPVVPLGALTAG